MEEGVMDLSVQQLEAETAANDTLAYAEVECAQARTPDEKHRAQQRLIQAHDRVKTIYARRPNPSVP